MRTAHQVCSKTHGMYHCSLVLISKQAWTQISAKVWTRRTQHTTVLTRTHKTQQGFDPIYSVIQKDGLNFISLYFKIRTSDKYDVNYIWFQVLCSLYGVDLRGLRSKISWIRLTLPSDTRGRPELLPLHRQLICSNWWFQRQMLFLVGGWMLKRRRNARCAAVADLVLMNSRTQKILCCIVAIFLSTDAAARLCARRAL